MIDVEEGISCVAGVIAVGAGAAVGSAMAEVDVVTVVNDGAAVVAAVTDVDGKPVDDDVVKDAAADADAKGSVIEKVVVVIASEADCSAPVSVAVVTTNAAVVDVVGSTSSER